jgi:hypothetical protein
MKGKQLLIIFRFALINFYLKNLSLQQKLLLTIFMQIICLHHFNYFISSTNVLL